MTLTERHLQIQSILGRLKYHSAAETQSISDRSTQDDGAELEAFQVLGNANIT